MWDLYIHLEGEIKQFKLIKFSHFERKELWCKLPVWTDYTSSNRHFTGKRSFSFVVEAGGRGPREAEARIAATINTHVGIIRGPDCIAVTISALGLIQPSSVIEGVPSRLILVRRRLQEGEPPLHSPGINSGGVNSSGVALMRGGKGSDVVHGGLVVVIVVVHFGSIGILIFFLAAGTFATSSKSVEVAITADFESAFTGRSVFPSPVSHQFAVAPIHLAGFRHLVMRMLAVIARHLVHDMTSSGILESSREHCTRHKLRLVLAAASC